MKDKESAVILKAIDELTQTIRKLIASQVALTKTLIILSQKEE